MICISKIYSYKTSISLRHYRDIIYTLWLKNFIGNLEAHSTIAYPCSLQGGGERNVFIGNNTNIQSHCVLGCWEKYGKQYYSPQIIIGNHCSIGEYNHITSINKVTIGDGLLTGRFVLITDNNHGEMNKNDKGIPPIERQLSSKGEVIIGNNVWIGDKVTILSGVHIGDNVIIAANSVVTKDAPNNVIIAGIPAEIVKRL